MKCEFVCRQLAIYQELTADEQNSIQQHLRHCPKCATVWRAYQAQDRDLASLPQVSPSDAMVAAVLSRTTRRPRRALGATRRFGMVLALCVLAFLVIFMGTLPTVAAGALPGDFLYPVKRASEQVRMTFTLDHQARARYAEELQQKRIEEVEAVVELGRDVQVDFSGRLQAVEDGTWIVEGVRVEGIVVAAGEAPPQIGQVVAIQASVVSGRVAASRVEIVKPTSMPGDVSATLTDTPAPRPSPTAAVALPTPPVTNTPVRSEELPVVTRTIDRATERLATLRASRTLGVEATATTTPDSRALTATPQVTATAKATERLPTKWLVTPETGAVATALATRTWVPTRSTEVKPTPTATRPTPRAAATPAAPEISVTPTATAGIGGAATPVSGEPTPVQRPTRVSVVTVVVTRLPPRPTRGWKRPTATPNTDSTDSATDRTPPTVRSSLAKPTEINPSTVDGGFREPTR